MRMLTTISGSSFASKSSLTRRPNVSAAPCANASHLDALNNLGFVRFAQKRHSDSAKCFRDALRINSQQPHAHNHLGNALFELGKRAEAAACYREAVRLHPSFADAHYNLANTLQAQGQLDEAVACFQEALSPAAHACSGAQ